MKGNHSQEVRSSMIYSSNSKGNIYSKSPMLSNQPTPPLSMPFHNPYGLREDSNLGKDPREMSKSTFMKQDNYMESFVRETKDKFFRLQKRLSDQEQELSDMRLKTSNGGSTEANLSYSVDSDYKLQTKIFQEIDKVRQEVNVDFLRKEALDFAFNRFELECLDKLVGKKELINRVEEIRDKTNHELQRMFEVIKMELDSSINQVHDVNRVVFSRIQKDMSEMKNLLDQQKYHTERLSHMLQQQQQPMCPGSKKCFGGVKLLKYQETIQRLGAAGGEEIVLSECVYYVDREGFLLDQNGYYLLNKMEQQIQLDHKHIALLKKNNVLF